MFLHYDVKHRISNFKELIYFKFIKIDIFEYYLLKFSSLLIKKMTFFKIALKIEILIY